MSDEIRPEDEVEAHGPLPTGPVPEGPIPEGPLPEAHDDEPDVEAHGRLMGPIPEGPVPEGPVPE